MDSDGNAAVPGSGHAQTLSCLLYINSLLGEACHQKQRADYQAEQRPCRSQTTFMLSRSAIVKEQQLMHDSSTEHVLNSCN